MNAASNLVRLHDYVRGLTSKDPRPYRVTAGDRRRAAQLAQVESMRAYGIKRRAQLRGGWWRRVLAWLVVKVLFRADGRARFGRRACRK